MPSTNRTRSKRPSTKKSRRPAAGRPAATRSPRPAGARPARGRRSRQRSPLLIATIAAVAVAAVTAGIVYAMGRDGASTATAGTANPYVGGDLHTLAAVGGALYVGGHDGVAVSTDRARTWTPVPSLDGADAMGWAQTSSGLLVGGHPGLFRSTDGGVAFAAVDAGQVTDVHAIGAAGDVVYLASPRAGLLASGDGGTTWEARNPSAGQSFMGTILVDPTDPQRLLAPDMQSGLMTSNDGGRTWTSTGAPATMAVAWDPTNTQRLVAVGMDGGATSNDGGRTWSPLSLPAGTSAVTYSADGRTLYAAALDGDAAAVSASTDGGTTWQ
jgi:photosystem II stability/assembly factor-like uncharacterized protein